MFRRVGVAALLALGLSGQALAGFNSWSTSVENDPFSGGIKVTVDFAASMRSGVLIVCDTAQTGLMVRAVPGFEFADVLKGARPVLEFAIDGDRLMFQQGVTGAVGENLAAAQAQLTFENAKALATAFTKAKRQIAIKDGISDRPFLLRVSGSSKAGAALNKCLDKQSVAKPNVSEEPEGSADDIQTDAGRFVRFKAYALTAEAKCGEYRLKKGALQPSGLDDQELATVELNIMDGEKRDAAKALEAKSCFAALREPLRFTKLGFDQVWEKK